MPSTNSAYSILTSPKEKHRVFVSRELLETLGKEFMEGLGDIAGKDVLVLDKSLYQHIKENHGEAASPINEFAAINRLSMGDERSRTYYNVDYSDLERRFSADQVGKQSPSARGLSPNSGLVLVPHESMFEPYVAASMISGIPKEQLSNIPGTRSDWMKVVIAHEVGHLKYNHTESMRDFIEEEEARLRQDKNFSVGENYRAYEFTVKREVQADKAGLKHAFDLSSSEGSVFEKAYISLRNIATFHRSSDIFDAEYFPLRRDAHDTSPYLKQDQDPDSAKVWKTTRNRAMANTLIFGVVGAVDGLEAVAKKGSFTSYIDCSTSKDLIHPMVKKHGPEDLKEVIEGGNPRIVINLGQSMTSDPKIMYAAAKALEGRGDLVPNSRILDELRSYTEAIDKYSPVSVDEQLIDHYQQGLKQEQTSDFIQRLDVYNNPNSITREACDKLSLSAN